MVNNKTYGEGSMGEKEREKKKRGRKKGGCRAKMKKYGREQLPTAKCEKKRAMQGCDSLSWP